MVVCRSVAFPGMHAMSLGREALQVIRSGKAKHHNNKIVTTTNQAKLKQAVASDLGTFKHISLPICQRI